MCIRTKRARYYIVIDPTMFSLDEDRSTTRGGRCARPPCQHLVGRFLFRDDDCQFSVSSSRARPPASDDATRCFSLNGSPAGRSVPQLVHSRRAMHNSRSIRCALQRVADKCMVQRPRWCRRNTGPGRSGSTAVRSLHEVTARARARAHLSNKSTGKQQSSVTAT